MEEKGIRFHNTASGKVEKFEPLDDKKVKMYVCGPTVYDAAHLGHGRSAVSFDVMRRYLIYKGYEVTYASNYTDIDDKMINRANEEGISVDELTKRIVPLYEEDYGKLGVMPPDIVPYATQHVPEMIELIKKLEADGHTYTLDDGVYFSVDSYPAYGEFSGRNLDELKMGARVEIDEDKKNPCDFVLWKFKKEGEPFWESSWGDGRPGWHIECSAMTRKHLGERFDIHGGGLDLVFPHHECEVAQSRGAFGPDSFAKYWIHNGFITIDKEKMSKSLGNFFTLREIFKKYDPKVVRLMFLQTHYRNPIDFSLVLLDQAKAALEKLRNFVLMLKSVDENFPVGVVDGVKADSGWAAKMIEQFDYFMDDDFNTSGALGAVFNMIGVINGINSLGNLTQAIADSALEALKKVDNVLAVIFDDDLVVDGEVEKLIKLREEARKSKDFATSDRIRNELDAQGIILEDTSNGTIWKRKI